MTRLIGTANQSAVQNDTGQVCALVMNERSFAANSTTNDPLYKPEILGQ
ncbi:MAG TPA: hypothetical protein VF088_21330 [Pyrinomonadaceae bacterium]